MRENRRIGNCKSQYGQAGISLLFAMLLLFVFPLAGYAQTTTTTAPIPLGSAVPSSATDSSVSFGASVAMDETGTLAVAGAPGLGENIGAVFPLVKNADGWSLTGEMITAGTLLDADLTSPGDFFGGSVAIDGDNLIVGARADAGNVGAAYIFRQSGGVWVPALASPLSHGDVGSGDYFGDAVDISGDYVIVGSHLDDSNYTDSGSAYVYRYTGTEWVFDAKLTADGSIIDSEYGWDSFGDSVGITSVNGVMYALAGAPLDGVKNTNGSDNNEGSVYVFERDDTTGTWIQTDKVTIASANTNANFGTTIAISGSTVLVGAYGQDSRKGAVYVYTLNSADGTLSGPGTISASDGAAGDRFGISLALSGSEALIGAPRHGGTGAAYGYQISGTTGSLTEKFIASDSTSGNLFGTSVAANTDVLIGATGRENGRGAVYTEDPGTIVDNFPPAFVSGIADQYAAVNTSLAIPITVRDIDDSQLSVSVTPAASNVTVEGYSSNDFTLPLDSQTKTGAFTILADNISGDTTIGIQLTDSSGATESASFNIITSSQPAGVNITGDFDLTVDEDSSVTASYTVTDQTGGLVEVSVRTNTSDKVPCENVMPVGTSWSNLGCSGGELTLFKDLGSSTSSSLSLVFEPAPDAYDLADLTISVNTLGSTTGGTDTVISKPVSLTINPFNDPPGLSAIMDQSIDEDVLFGPIPLTITDDSASVTLRVESSSPGVIPEILYAYPSASGEISGVGLQSADVTGNDTDASLTLTFPADTDTAEVDLYLKSAQDAFGTTQITIFADDGEAPTEGQTSFMVTVNAVAEGPEINNLPATATTEEEVPVDVTFSVRHGDGAPITVTASSGNQLIVPNSNLDMNNAGATYSPTLVNKEASINLTITPAENRTGTVPISITATDDSGQSVTQTLQLTITERNDPPTISSISSQTTLEDRSLTVDFTVSDLDDVAQACDPNDPTLECNDSTLTVAVSEVGGPLVETFSLNGTNVTPREVTAEGVYIFDVPYTLAQQKQLSLTITPAGNANGQTSVEISVCDGTDCATCARCMETTQTFNLTITAVNDQPVLDISTIPDPSTIEEDTQFGPVSFTVTDVDGDNLSVSAFSNNPALVPTSAISFFPSSGSTRYISITPTADESGEALITITVSDPSGATDEGSFTLIVTSLNDPPTISEITDKTTAEDTPISVSFSFDDIDSDLTGLTVSANSDNQDLVPDGNLVVTRTDTTGTVTITPAPNANSTQFGTAVITVNVTDGGGAVGRESFVLTVTAVNDDPTVSDVPNQSIQEDTTMGPVPFTVGDIDGDSVTVTVTSNNQALVPNSNIDMNGGFGNSFTPPLVDKSATINLTITPVPEENGSAVITITVTDSNNATVTDVFLLEVIADNDPPTISDILSQTINEDPATPLTINFSVDDIDGDELTVTATSTNQDLVPDANITVTGTGSSRTLTLTPAQDANSDLFGTTQIIVTADDGTATAQETFFLTVNPVNDAPVVQNIDAFYQIQEDGILTISDDFAPIICDIDSNNLNLNLSLVSSTNPDLFPEGSFTISEGGVEWGTNYVLGGLVDGCNDPAADLTLTLDPAPDESGSAEFTLQVRDDFNPSASTSFQFQVNVAPVNDPPIMTGTPPTTAYDDIEYIFTPEASDPEGTTLTFSIDPPESSLPAWLSFDTTTGTLSGTPTNADVGTIVENITITATDASGLSASIGPFSIEVLANIIPPTVTNVTDQTMVEDTTIELPFTVGDENGDLLIIKAVSDNPDLIAEDGLSIVGTNVQGDGNLVALDTVPDQPETLTLRITPVANANSDKNGNATITITVDDNSGQIAADTFTVTVTQEPDAPKLLGIPLNLVLSIDEGETVRLSTYEVPIDFRVSDVDIDIVEVTATSSNQTLIPNSNIKISPPDEPNPLLSSYLISFPFNGSDEAPMDIQITPASFQSGQAVITVTATDQAGLTTQAQFIVNVGNVSDAPEILNVSVPTSPIPEETETEIPFTVRDWDDDVLTLEAVEVDENGNPVTDGLFVDPIRITGTGVFTDVDNSTKIDVQPGEEVSLALLVTGAPNETGTGFIKITVTDQTGQVAQRTFSVTVEGLNDPPTIEPIPNLTINEDPQNNPMDPPVLPIPLTVNDPDGDSLQISVQSSNQNLIPDSGFALLVNGQEFALPQTVTAEQYNTLELVVRPVENATGTVTVTITVDDGQASPVTRTFSLTITPVPDSPTISAISNKTMNEDDDPATINPIPFTVSDPDGGTLTIFIHSNNETIVPNDVQNIFVEGPTGVISDVINDVDAANRNGVKVTLEVQPGVETPLSLTILPAEDQFTSGTPVLIDLTVDDTQPETPPATEDFTLTINPVNDPPTVSQIVGPKFTLVNTPTDPIKFFIDDAETATANLIVDVTSSNQTLVSDSNITVSTISEPDFNRQMVIQPNGGETGETTITVSVTDGQGLTAEESFVLKVTPASTRAAFVDAIDDKVMDEDTSITFTFSVSFPLESGETLTDVLAVSARSSNTDLVPNGAPYLFVDWLSSPTSREHTYQLTIDPPQDVPWEGIDETTTITVSAVTKLTNSFTHEEDFVLRVNPINDPPIIQGITEGEEKDTFVNVPLSFSFTLIDVDGEPVGVTVTSSNETLIPVDNIDIDGLDNQNTVSPDPVIGATLIMTITPEQNRNGFSTITITADDGISEDTVSFIVNVNISGCPIITNVDDLTVNRNDQDIPVFFSVTDEEGGILTIDTTSSNTGLLPDSGMSLSVVSPAGESLGADGTIFTEPNETFMFSLTMNPNTSAFGETTVTITAVDESQKSCPETFRLTVREVLPGDVNNDGTVNLTDAILALQVLSGLTPAGVTAKADVNGDLRIGLEEVVYIMQYVAELR